MTQRAVTIADVAAAAGVSVPTVSKVLNGRKGVSADTRQQVEKILQQRGYERRGRPVGSGLVDFVISDLETQWAATLLCGAQLEAARLGLDLVVTTTQGRPIGSGADWLDHVVQRGSQGVVMVVSELLPAARAELSRLHLPLVLIDPVGAAGESFPTVVATDWAGSRDATDHLIGLGHRRIATVTGPMAQACHQDRLDGYRTALQRAGIDYDESLVRHGDSLVASGRASALELLAAADRPTAVLCGSDEQAYGVYLAARELGLSIPGDLSVVGFDDVDLCQWVSPQLTTVRQPLDEMARLATRLAFDLSRGDSSSPRSVALSTSLVVRESTAPPAA